MSAALATYAHQQLQPIQCCGTAKRLGTRCATYISFSVLVHHLHCMQSNGHSTNGIMCSTELPTHLCIPQPQTCKWRSAPITKGASTTITAISCVFTGAKYSPFMPTALSETVVNKAALTE